MKALRLGALGPRRRSGAPPIEHSLLLTVTLCLVALGVVMVFSASSTTSLLGESGDGAYYLKRTLLFGVFGLLAMRVLAIRGVAVIYRLTPLIMAVSIGLLIAVLLPGVGMEANGAQRWIGAGLFQIQPSEVAKVALVLHGAALLATRPRLCRSVGEMVPFLMPVGVICGLVVLEPDLGTAMVACFTAFAMLVAAGAKMRHLGLIGAVLVGLILVVIVIEPYRMERLTGFINPSADPAGAGFQATQAQIALGSGGTFGVGIGESLQKAFYLPEAHTDMIAAVIGEEMGLLGMVGLAAMFGLFAYAGMRTAQRARDRYTKLLAAGLVSLVMVQATINLFAVMGLAPLTGVPLPFVSYGNSSLLMMLAAVGLLLNIAAGARVPAAAPRPEPSGTRRAKRRAPAKRAPAKRSRPRRAPMRRPVTARAAAGDAKLRVVEGGRAGGPGRSQSSRANGRDSRGRNSGPRGARAGRRGRASG
ncbi:MAG: putative lipid II flippase FtsW [Solirubrobacterales bacterium]